MPDLSPVKPGEPLRMPSASRTNALLATSREDQGLPLRADHRGVGRFPAQQNDQIWVRNDSNFEFDRYAVVGLDDAIWPTADDAVATDSFLNEPIFSIRPPEGCRHQARFGVLVQPLLPGEVGRAVISGSVNAYVGRKVYDGGGEPIGTDTVWPSRHQVFVEVDPEASGVEYHTTQYGRRRRDGLWFNYSDGSGQVLWAGPDFAHHSYANLCTGTVDIECEPGGTAYMITRDTCGEGCSAWEAISGYATPCTPGTEHLALACYGVTGELNVPPHRFGANPESLALVRIGNGYDGADQSACGCAASACRSECVADDCVNQCTFTSIADGGSPTGWTWQVSTTGCDDPCRCQTIAELVADVGYPAGSGEATSSNCTRHNTDWFWTVVMNACHPTATPTTSTSFDPSTTTTSADPSTTTTTTAAPECACPDLNILQATWPELYPCGATEAVKFQTHFCYTTTTTTTTSTTSTTSSTSTSTSTTSSTSTSTSTTLEPCDGDCHFVHDLTPACNYSFGSDTCTGPVGCGCDCYIGMAGGVYDACTDIFYPDALCLFSSIGPFACKTDVPPPTTTSTSTSSTTTSEEPTTTSSTTSTTSEAPTSTTSTSNEPTSSTTTSEEPTTTTTAEPCTGDCTWECQAGGWQNTSATCSQACGLNPCVEPVATCCESGCDFAWTQTTTNACVTS